MWHSGEDVEELYCGAYLRNCTQVLIHTQVYIYTSRRGDRNTQVSWSVYTYKQFRSILQHPPYIYHDVT